MKILKTLSKRTLLVVTLTGLPLALALVLFFVLKNPAQHGPTSLTTNTVTPPKQEKVNPGLPVRLKIPKINVDAVVEYVGLTSQGDMGAPKGPDGVAWYKLGPRPGDNGSAVMAGHYGRWKNGQGSVFDNLSKLIKGDNLYVIDEKGATTTFVVRELRTYNPNDDHAEVFISKDGKAHLSLITCEGVWNEAQKTYSNRLVVFTDKE
jgi:LPXTG-site transpeptidase (sortase) family protein